MKKFLALFLALVLVFSLAACGKQAEEETKDTDPKKEDVAKKPDKTGEDKTTSEKTDKETGKTDPEKTDKQPGGETATKPTEGNNQSVAQPSSGDTGSSSSGETGSSGETVTPADVDLSSFSFGVKEDGNNVLVTVKNQTDAGDVTCVMTFKYDGDTLASETADYYVPDNDTAKALADELKKDSTVVSDSVKVEGNCVSCTMKDSEIAELRELSRAELVEAMQYAIDAAQ